MANTKQSPAARREQERRQRQRTTQGRSGQGRSGQGRSAPKKGPSSNKGWWWFVGIMIVVVIGVIGLFVVLGNQQTQQAQQGYGFAYKTVTTIPADSFSRVNTGSITTNPIVHLTGTPVLKGPDGKPEVLFVGAEYCPYCAAQRYVILSALSRFGTFSNVTEITSSESSLPTFSLHNSTFKSNYIDFVAKETVDNSNQPLDTLSSQETAIVQKYDNAPYFPNSNPGSIPFMSIANQYISSGAFYDNTLLSGKSYTDIANQLSDTNSALAQGVLGGANYLTASICSATNNQPSTVCNTSSIQTLEQTIQKTGVQGQATNGSALAMLSTNADVPHRS